LIGQKYSGRVSTIIVVPGESGSCLVEGPPSIEFCSCKEVKEFGNSTGSQCRIENILYRIYNDGQSGNMFDDWRCGRKNELFDETWNKLEEEEGNGERSL